MHSSVATRARGENGDKSITETEGVARATTRSGTKLTASDGLVTGTREVTDAVSVLGVVGDGARRPAPALISVLFVVFFRHDVCPRERKETEKRPRDEGEKTEGGGAAQQGREEHGEGGGGGGRKSASELGETRDQYRRRTRSIPPPPSSRNILQSGGGRRWGGDMLLPIRARVRRCCLHATQEQEVRAMHEARRGREHDGNGARIHHKWGGVCLIARHPKTGKKTSSMYLRGVVQGAFVVAVHATGVRGHIVLHDHVGHHTVVPGVAVAAHEVLAAGGLLRPLHLVERERPIAPASLGLCRTRHGVVGGISHGERSATHWADIFSDYACED